MSQDLCGCHSFLARLGGITQPNKNTQKQYSPPLEYLLLKFFGRWPIYFSENHLRLIFPSFPAFSSRQTCNPAQGSLFLFGVFGLKRFLLKPKKCRPHRFGFTRPKRNDFLQVSQLTEKNPPSQDAIVTTRTIVFLVGDSYKPFICHWHPGFLWCIHASHCWDVLRQGERFKTMPLLLGRGTTQGTSTLPATIMVQWKMGVSPIFVSFHYGRKAGYHLLPPPPCLPTQDFVPGQHGVRGLASLETSLESMAIRIFSQGKKKPAKSGPKQSGNPKGWGGAAAGDGGDCDFQPQNGHLHGNLPGHTKYESKCVFAQ